MEIKPVDPAGELVSVVVPAYNAGATLRETLASALAQTHRNLEVIVVDDGSTDETASIAEAVAAEDPRVRVVRQANAGVAAARNRGIEAASGELIAPLDADDLWHPEKIARQVAALRRGGPRVGLVYCWFRQIDEASRVVASGGEPRFEGEVYALLVLLNFVGNASTPLIRRSYITAVGGFDTSLRARGAQGCEDAQLYLAIAERYDFVVVPQFLVGYRQIAGSMAGDIRQMVRSADLVWTDVRRRHPELPKRLFRWARARYQFWLGVRNLQYGRSGAATRLFFQAALHDPAIVLYLSFISRVFLKHWLLSVHPAALRAVTALRSRTRLKNKGGGDVHGQPFLTVPAEPVTATNSFNSFSSHREWLLMPRIRTDRVERRLPYVASLRIRRRCAATPAIILTTG